MVFERVKELCKKNGITPTALCVRITGSKGNLSTWKKGNIRSDYLVAIASMFDTTTDYLLGIKTDTPEGASVINDDLEAMCLRLFSRLPPSRQVQFLESMLTEVLENQEAGDK